MIQYRRGRTPDCFKYPISVGEILVDTQDGAFHVGVGNGRRVVFKGIIYDGPLGIRSGNLLLTRCGDFVDAYSGVSGVLDTAGDTPTLEELLDGSIIVNWPDEKLFLHAGSKILTFKAEKGP